MKNTVNLIRRHCDRLLNETERLYGDMVVNLKTDQGLIVPRGPLHESVYNAFITARLAKAWTGKALQYLFSDADPYPVADTPTEIPEEVDKFSGYIYCSTCDSSSYKLVLDALNQLRSMADIIIKGFDVEALEDVTEHTKGDVAMLEVWKELHVYKFHLGFALGIMRNAVTSKK
jgi:hypothetical protein